MYMYMSLYQNGIKQNHGFGASPGDQYVDLGHPATENPTRNHDDFGS